MHVALYSLQIVPVVSVVAHSSGEWTVLMKMGQQERLCGKTLRRAMKIVFEALSGQHIVM